MWCSARPTFAHTVKKSSLESMLIHPCLLEQVPWSPRVLQSQLLHEWVFSFAVRHVAELLVLSAKAGQRECVALETVAWAAQQNSV